MCSWQPLQYVTSAFGNDCLHHIKINRDKISKRPFSYSGKSLLFSKIRAGGAGSCNNDTIWEKFEHCFIARMMMISQNCGANISELCESRRTSYSSSNFGRCGIAINLECQHIVARCCCHHVARYCHHRTLVNSNPYPVTKKGCLGVIRMSPKVILTAHVSRVWSKCLRMSSGWQNRKRVFWEVVLHHIRHKIIFEGAPMRAVG